LASDATLRPVTRAGFNPVVDNVFTPIAMLAMRISPRHIAGPAGRFYFWGLRTFSRPPYGTRLRLEAEGLYRDRPARAAITLAHPDGYAFTAIPVVASLLQWLDGDRRPGLWLQAEYVEPLRFLRDLERLGIGVVIEDEASVLGAWETSDIMRS
jgi:saccharopine dehydrogenase (NAD+, L-lysine-forming)